MIKVGGIDEDDAPIAADGGQLTLRDQVPDRC
jgi:hypothetical protein